jgi:hypothetical protein
MSPFLSRFGALGVNDCRCGACFAQGLPLAAGRKQIINRNDRVEHFATSTERLRARADSKAQ